MNFIQINLGKGKVANKCLSKESLWLYTYDLSGDDLYFLLQMFARPMQRNRKEVQLQNSVNKDRSDSHHNC